jgi:sporulation protein YlmC with PRC-barrel domain
MSEFRRAQATNRRKSMTKTFMLGAAISALMVSGALAQSPPSASTPASPPAASSPSSSTPASGKADIVSSQNPDQWLASKFKGTDVVGADDQKIGDVSDILFDKTGTIQAYVVSVGGFLGMGAKEVALAPKSFTAVPGQNGAADKLKVSMSKDELTQAQNFARYEPPRPTATTGTGAGGAGGTLGGGAGGSRPTGGGAPANR